tara:strand:- start:5201 stop:5734 length:534 start_codon:yes stop_codon:yes gene_type:complete
MPINEKNLRRGTRERRPSSKLKEAKEAAAAAKEKKERMKARMDIDRKTERKKRFTSKRGIKNIDNMLRNLTLSGQQQFSPATVAQPFVQPSQSYFQPSQPFVQPSQPLFQPSQPFVQPSQPLFQPSQPFGQNQPVSKAPVTMNTLSSLLASASMGTTKGGNKTKRRKNRRRRTSKRR